MTSNKKNILSLSVFTALNDLVLINLKIECSAIFWEMKLEFQIRFKRLGDKKLALKKV